jgi:hypothetical protein
MSESNPGAARAQRVAEVVEPFRTYFASLDRASLYQRPAPEEWSPMMVAAHVAEILIYWSEQAREVAARASDGEPFGRTHEDPDRIAAVENHAEDAPETTLARLDEGLATATATLRGLSPQAWRRTARHARRGEMTIAQFVDLFLIDHVLEHTAQLQASVS